MTFRRATSHVAAKFMICMVVAVGLAVLGCGSETIATSPTKKIEQKEFVNQNVNQGAKSKSGKTVGAPINVKSIKQKVLNAQKE
jgi:hypothetical protein